MIFVSASCTEKPLLPSGISSLSGDRRVHPHPQHPDRAHQDPTLVPQGAEPGPGSGVPRSQDLPGREREEARSLCVSHGVTEQRAGWPQHLKCFYHTGLEGPVLSFTFRSLAGGSVVFSHLNCA